MTSLPFPPQQVITRLKQGVVIPAHPLALNSARKLDEKRQRALTRYYCDAGAGGIAVGVHTTQFEIRDPRFGLFEPVLTLAADGTSRCGKRYPRPSIKGRKNSNEFMGSSSAMK